MADGLAILIFANDKQLIGELLVNGAERAVFQIKEVAIAHVVVTFGNETKIERSTGGLIGNKLGDLPGVGKLVVGGIAQGGI